MHLLVKLLLCAVPIIAVKFDPVETNRFLYYSYAAYCENVSNWDHSTYGIHIPDFLFHSLMYNSTSEIRGYTGYNPKYNEIVVAYRGSYTIKNWIKNIDSRHVTVDIANTTVNVEAGFFYNYISLVTQAEDSLKYLLSAYPDAPVYFTGHSLGGALASLAVVDLNWRIIQGSTDVRTITFGSPRVASKNFLMAHQQATKSYSFRVTHQNDVVPHVPPYSFDYHHVGTEIWNTGTEGIGQFRVCDDSGEDPTCSWSVPVTAYSITDHLYYLNVYETCSNGLGLGREGFSENS